MKPRITAELNPAGLAFVEFIFANLENIRRNRFRKMKIKNISFHKNKRSQNVSLASDYS